MRMFIVEPWLASSSDDDLHRSTLPSAAPGPQEEVVYLCILDLLGSEWSIAVNRLSAVLHYHGLCIRTVTRYEQWTVR